MVSLGCDTVEVVNRPNVQFVSAPARTVEVVASPVHDVLVANPGVRFDVERPPSTRTVVVAWRGAPGPPGPGASDPELYDSATPPVAPPIPYLRFERDVDGDVQAIYLGTVD